MASLDLISKNLTRDQLFDPDTQEEVFSAYEDIVSHGKFYQGKQLAVWLESKLGKDYPDVLSPTEQTYRRMINNLRVFSLNFWKDEEIVDVLRYNLVDSFDDPEISAIDRISAKLVELDYDLRDRFKEKLRQSIYLSEQRLTNKYLILDKEEVVGTVKNWLRDYLINVGGDSVGALERAKYLSSSKNVRILSRDEKIRLASLIDLYEYLKLPALSPEGFDEEIIFEEDGQRKRFYRGIIEDLEPVNSKPLPTPVEKSVKTETVTPKQTPVPAKDTKETQSQHPLTPEQIMDLYHGGDVERARIKEEDTKVSSQTSNDFNKTLAILIQAIDPPPGAGRNKWAAMAALRQMAKNHQLDDLLKNSQINNLLVKYLKATNEKSALDGYLLSPTQPVNFKWLLRCIFEYNLKLPEGTVARWGLQLCTLAKKAGEAKFADMAYFDLKSQKFVWK